MLNVSSLVLVPAVVKFGCPITKPLPPADSIDEALKNEYRYGIATINSGETRAGAERFASGVAGAGHDLSGVDNRDVASLANDAA